MIEVREARPEDLAAAGELTDLAYLADVLITEDDDYRVRLRDAAARAREAVLLVATLDDAVVGTITVAGHGGPWSDIAEPGEVELRMLAVDPAYRGRGVGEALLRAGIEHGLAAGAERVVLSTMTAMATAQRMYDRIGLHRVPERDWRIETDDMLVYTT